MVASSMLILQSASGGRAANGEMDCTGTPGSSGTCGGYCHTSAGLFPNPQLSIEVKDATGLGVTSYIPGQVYTLEFTVSSDGSPSGYGMQAVLLDGLNANAGTLLAVATDSTQITTISNGRSFVEHKGLNDLGLFRASWRAPVAGTGVITISGVGLASNGSGSTQGDDFSATASFVLTESIASQIDEIEAKGTVIQVFPNPSKGAFFVESQSESARWKIRVINLHGQLVYQEDAYLEPFKRHHLMLENLVRGIYWVEMSKEGQKEVVEIRIE